MRKTALIAALAAFGLLAGQASAKERYTYLHHATPTNVFWQAVKKGMDEACAQIDADCQMVFLQQDGNFQEQLNNLEATIAQKPDGIIVVQRPHRNAGSRARVSAPAGLQPAARGRSLFQNGE